MEGGGKEETTKVVKEDSAIIDAVKKADPAVVSIVITKDVPKLEQYYSNPFGNDPFFRQFFGDQFNTPQYRQKGTEKKEVGGGSGFIVSSDGLIVSNNHVVSDKEAEYTVLTNDGKKYPAKVLARDSVKDLAVLKIEKTGLPTLGLGDSDNLQAGQTVIAIGNALGEFRNTVSAGIISGLKRSVTASGFGAGTEQLTNVIQTDAAINPGNSGGPLLNLSGEVIGVNVAMAQGAENIGFALPINDVKKAISDVEKHGKIITPYMGVRYILVNSDIKEKNNLSVDYGALVVRGEMISDLAVIPGSPADKAGIVENNIILKVNGTKVDSQNPLANLINKYSVGDEITLRILHRGEEKDIKVKLEERKAS
ncbi:trypsin-like peptidase domain-containing protein [Patescibacteria group bacterium]|nr:trypsin-like peptidase domain-containing protein [Patescibacteria group bacterium]